MELNRQLARLLTVPAAIALGLAACHGASPTATQYVPAGTSGVSSSQLNLAVTPANKEHGEIISSCGRHIRLTVAGIVHCHFREPGYGDGKFTLHDHTNGLILISPDSGGKHRKFTITGLLVGSGYFTVNDTNGHSLRITVKVTL